MGVCASDFRTSRWALVIQLRIQWIGVLRRRCHHGCAARDASSINASAMGCCTSIGHADSQCLGGRIRGSALNAHLFSHANTSRSNCIRLSCLSQVFALQLMASMVFISPEAALRFEPCWHSRGYLLDCIRVLRPMRRTLSASAHRFRAQWVRDGPPPHCSSYDSYHRCGHISTAPHGHVT